MSHHFSSILRPLLNFRKEAPTFRAIFVIRPWSWCRREKNQQNATNFQKRKTAGVFRGNGEAFCVMDCCWWSTIRQYWPYCYRRNASSKEFDGKGDPNYRSRTRKTPMLVSNPWISVQTLHLVASILTIGLTGPYTTFRYVMYAMIERKLSAEVERN